MTTTSVSARLASDGLQQHIHAARTNVAEGCKGRYQSCGTSRECCPELWCSWAFQCERVG